MQQPTPAPSSPPESPVLPPSSPVLEPATQIAVTAEDHALDYPAPPQNVGSAPFHVLAALFDKLQNERKPEKRRKLLDSWFNHWREEKGYDLYPVLRLILPQKDRERSVYGMKEKNLAKAYIKLIPLGLKDPDAIRLLNWKKPAEKDKSSGDFPTVLYEVICKRSSVMEGSLSVNELNDLLDQLSQNMGKSEIQTRILQRVYNRSTPEEQRWVVRIILKDMVISVKETTVFSVFHPDAHDLYNTCSDLKKIAWELWDPERRLNDEDKAVQLFRAFAPMLCKRPARKLDDSIKEMQGRAFIMEEKLDGERMQLHKRGNEYFYCSRKGKDYTYLYGKHVGDGSLTPFIHNAFDERVDEIILDGEMLVWDPVSERNMPFGSLKTAALGNSKGLLNPRPCFKVFDLLYLNGMSLLRKSLRFRKRNLRACLQEVPGRVEFAEESEGRTVKDGLVIKHPDSEYILNGRNKDWIKVKPEYMDNMGETVDVIVVAGNYGSGRRSGGVSTLICAVLDDRNPDATDGEPQYSSFVRIGTGLSYADYIWIRHKPWKTWDTRKPPSFLQVSPKGSEDKGDVYLEPADSFIVKVKASEITSSDLYHLGLTMRFPRALLIRDDLGVSDCMTASDVLRNLQTVKKRKMVEDDGKPKKKKKTAKQVSVMREYQGVDLKDVEVQSDLFEGMKFMVASDPKSRTGEQDKKDLLRLIRANGGSYVQIAKKDPDILVVYGGKITPYDIKLIMNKGVYDIIRPQWITDCISTENGLIWILPYLKAFFQILFHATLKRTEKEEYEEEEDSEDEAAMSATASAAGTATTPVVQDEDKDEDPSMAEWFKVDKQTSGLPLEEADSETEPETEPDSDNEDVQRDEDVVPEQYEDVALEQEDDWLEVISRDDASVPTTPATMDDEDEQDRLDVPRMGENDDAMHYDEDLIFKHLCFYLDSPDNARKHGMVVRAKNEDALNESFAALSKMVTNNGGRIVDLNEPKLTHVVVDKRDVSRRLELIKRTSQPKRRNMVISEFIQACVDEDTLLDEDEFSP
ncbi:hypothetical protein B0H21DRAFT_878850 [Amylocystis lapponica]|nr:hypothetical protein B0H21DRAFT_878850 [Amylocystis lapponica]